MTAAIERRRRTGIAGNRRLATRRRPRRQAAAVRGRTLAATGTELGSEAGTKTGAGGATGTAAGDGAWEGTGLAATRGARSW